MEEAIKYFLTLHNQIKLFHWGASSYAVHKALDDLHENMGILIDRFVECYIGHFKKQPMKPLKIKLDLQMTSDITQVHKFLTLHCKNLTEMTKAYADTPGFENILAEMVSNFDNTIYLCNLL